MESIILGINVIFPLLCYMFIGMALKKRGWVSEKTLTEMNRVVFRVFMFALVFLNTYNIEIGTIGTKKNLRMLVLALAVLGMVFVIASIYCRARKIEVKRSAVIVQGLYRSNLALFGLPVSIAIYGEGNLGAVSILLAVIVPIYNIIAVILLGNASGKSRFGLGTVVTILKNPLVTGTLLGLFVNILPIQLGGVMLDTITALSKVATPLAFIVLGGSLAISNLRKDFKDVMSVCTIRLIVIPMLVVGVAIALGLRERHIIALLGAFASPAAVASFTMSKEMDVEPELAGEIVAVSTIMSLITMFGWIVSLKNMGII